MPKTYIDNSQRWLDLSEVDYLGHFVKGWLAFNAWYRNTSTLSKDRAIMDEIKWQPNPVRNRLVPLLSSSTEEAEQFRSFIGILHHRLENYHLHSGKGAEKKRITLKEVYLKKNDGISLKSGSKYGMNYSVEPETTRNPMPITCTVTNRHGNQVFCFAQPKYDPIELESNPDFTSSLNATQQGFVKALYQCMNPIIISDLTNPTNKPEEEPIPIGTYQFYCSKAELFAGVCEVIYQMRNSLFHGELVPSREATACYEPAYHIIRKFLVCIS
jgi:hypothetical protein